MARVQIFLANDFSCCVMIVSSLGDMFPRSVWCRCGDGEFFVIGAPRDDDVGFDVGSAFVYFRTVDGWVFASKLLPSRESTAMEFGSQVVLGQDDIFVSALDTIFVLFPFPDRGGADLERRGAN